MNNYRLQILIAVCALLALALGVFAGKVWHRRLLASRSIHSLDVKIEALKQEIGELEDRLDVFNDPALVEQEAKARLHLKRPEEKVVFLVKGDGRGEESQVPEESAGQEIVDAKASDEGGSIFENPKRWWDYFFGTRD